MHYGYDWGRHGGHLGHPQGRLVLLKNCVEGGGWGVDKGALVGGAGGRVQCGYVAVVQGLVPVYNGVWYMGAGYI